MSDSLLRSAVVIGGGFIALAVIAVAAGSFVSVAFDVAQPQTQTAEIDIAGGSGDLPQPGQNRQYEQSLGDALQFNGAGDSQFSTGGTLELNGQAEVCTHARINNASANATVVAADGYLTIRYAGDRATNKWVATHYNRSDRTLYDVTTTATTPGDWTHVCARHENDTLLLAVNATDAATVTETGSHTTDAGTANYSNLNGTIDETRAYNAPLTSSERSTLYNTPTHPLESGAAARIMYDSFDSNPSNLPVYFTGQDGSISNANLVSGFAGQTLQEGTDYRIDGGDIVATDGAKLDRAPVVFSTYDGPGGPVAGVLSTLAGIGSSALILIVVGTLGLAASRVTGAMDGF